MLPQKMRKNCCNSILQGQSAWSPLAAAKLHLQHEKPEIYDRMNRTIATCKASRDIRKDRLDSLGEVHT